MDNANESAFQKFKRFFEAVLDDRKINVDFTDEDVDYLKYLFARFGFTLSSDSNNSYQNEQMCKNLLTRNLTLSGIFNAKSFTIVDEHNAISLDDGQEVFLPGKNKHFLCVREGDYVFVYNGPKIPKLIPFEEGKWNSWNNTVSQISAAPLLEADIWGPNNFADNLIRFYDQNGEITDLDKLDFTNCIHEIRNNIVHNNYKECVPIAKRNGKIFKNNRALILPVDRNKGICAIVEMGYIYRIFSMPSVRKEKHFSFFYLPPFEPLKTPEDCINLLKRYRTIKISLAKEEYISIVHRDIDNLTKLYDSLHEKIPLREFLESKLKSLGYDAQVQCIRIGAKAFEKVIIPKIVNSNCLYHFADVNTEEVPAEQICNSQRKYIQNIINGFYHFKIVEDQGILYKDDVRFISINQTAMKLITLTIFKNLDLLQNNQEQFYSNFSFHKPEYAIFLVYLSLYNNLIDNGFSDSVKNLPSFKNLRSQDEILSNKGKLRDIVNIINFEGIKIKPAKGGIKDVDFRDRVEAITKIRNGIHSTKRQKIEESNEENESIGSLKFRIRGEDNYKTMPLIFSPSKENDWAAQTDVNKFLKFISQPAFPQKQHQFVEMTWRDMEEAAIEMAKKYNKTKK